MTIFLEWSPANLSSLTPTAVALIMLFEMVFVQAQATVLPRRIFFFLIYVFQKPKQV